MVSVPARVWMLIAAVCALAVIALLADGFWYVAIGPFLGLLLSVVLALKGRSK